MSRRDGLRRRVTDYNPRVAARAVPAGVLVIYAGALSAFVYAFEHREDADRARQTGPDELLVRGSVAALHLLLGFAIGQWRAVLAALFPFLVAIPAGEYPGRWPEGYVAETILLQELVFGGPLILIGVGIRRLLGRRRSALADVRLE